MTTQKQATFHAHVDSIVMVVREWQSGAITWAECLRRANVTAEGEEVLRAITRTTPERSVWELATKAAG